ncbi:selenoprotein domain protein [Akanthomyces lecanii RCEF 1005]|uniref:Selenoprotein domain protein n=1 Tax=Akanthomyces lecanii RCEF 1005 TaxID=1081108 RepID=A0A168HV03_CORDF|nr:selenoprotein domain protein [Akanthomyces lecanii RCEF 1005]
MAEDDYATPAAAGTQRLPRVSIEFCTQCKWLLRAAYYAQELLSTFSTGLGEVALQPSTGGRFIVTIHHGAAGASGPEESGKTVLWDRKVDGGFPETKELKRRVRDVIEPGRGLGHVDKDYAKGAAAAASTVAEKKEEEKREEEKRTDAAGKECEDCK